MEISIFRSNVTNQFVSDSCELGELFVSLGSDLQNRTRSLPGEPILKSSSHCHPFPRVFIASLSSLEALDGSQSRRESDNDSRRYRVARAGRTQASISRAVGTELPRRPQNIASWASLSGVGQFANSSSSRVVACVARNCARRVEYFY